MTIFGPKIDGSDPVAYGAFRVSVAKIGVFMLCAGFWLLLLSLVAALTWWLLLIFTVPIYFLSERFGEKVFAAKYGWSTEQVGFSPKRIALGVLLVLGVSAAVFSVVKLFN